MLQLQVTMANTPGENFRYVPYSVTQQTTDSDLTPVSPPTPVVPTIASPNDDNPPSASPNDDTVPKPKPKPRTNYPVVEIRSPSPKETTTSNLQSLSTKLPPAVPKKPQNYSSIALRKSLAPLPSGKKEVPPLLSGKSLPAPLPSSEPSQPPASLPGSGIQNSVPQLPRDGVSTDGVDDSTQDDITQTTNVMDMVKKLSQTLPRKMETGSLELSSTPATSHSQKSRRMSENDIQAPRGKIPPPFLPDRIESCFVKQSSLDSEAKPTPPEQKRSTAHMAPTPADLNWHPTGETMTLSQLADTHSSRFPLKIHLLDGYYGQTSHFTLSSSDIFDIHFAKRTQVITVRDSLKTDYSIPLNSAIQLGIIFQAIPSKGTEKPPQTLFKTVQDLLSLDHLPKVMRATTKWSKPSVKAGKMSVEKSELLIVKGIYRPPLRNKRALKCYSLKTDARKLLPEECEGNFSVDPEHTKLHVYEFAKKLKAVLPCKAMMFLYTGSGYDSPVFRNVPKSLFRKPISILNVTTEVSLTATSVMVKEPPATGHRDMSLTDHHDSMLKPVKPALPMEIPLDSHLGDIEVEILAAPNETETEKLYINTQELLQKVNKEPYMILLDKGSDRINDTQSLFYQQVRSDKCRLGVALETSQTIYERMDIQRTNPTKAPACSYSKATTKKQEHKMPFSVVEDDGNMSDSSDEHMYEMIDDEIREKMFSPSLMPQLSRQAPLHALYPSPDIPNPNLAHFSPPHHPAHYSTNGQSYGIPQSPPTIYNQSPLHAQTHTPPSPKFNPLGVPSAQLSSASYVHMVPAEALQVVQKPSDAATAIAPETLVANQSFLKSMSVDEVSTLL